MIDFKAIPSGVSQVLFWPDSGCFIGVSSGGNDELF